MPTPSWTVSFTMPTASSSPAKACAGHEASRTRRLDQPPSPVTQIHRPARLATRAASFRYGGRHHSGIPGDIIPLYPGDFVGIRIFQIRVYDPLVPSLYFAPDLGQRIGCLSTLPIPKTAGIKDLLKDRLQAIGQCLLAHSIIDRGYAQRSGLAGGSSFRDLQPSHRQRLIGVVSELSMQPF